LKDDWHVIMTNPPDIVKVEDYNQSFQNFDGQDPIEFTFEHNVQVTTSDDYTQTRGFDVGVNADIPVSLLVMVNWRRFVLIPRLKAWTRWCLGRVPRFHVG
jgi:hypothetical protein